jgi:hypothetical protein
MLTLDAYCMMERDQVYFLALTVDPHDQVGSWATSDRHSLSCAGRVRWFYLETASYADF